MAGVWNMVPMLRRYFNRLAGLFFACNYCVGAEMTLTDLQVLTSDILDDPNNGYFTIPILNQRLNLNLRELQKRLLSANQQYYTTCVKTSTLINQAAYALPTDYIQIIRLEYVTQGSGTTAQTQKINFITPNQIDLLSETSGAPAFYYMQKNNLILAPTPDSVYELHLEYSYYVTDMVNAGDVPDAPQQFHPYIAYLTARDCMVKDGRPLNSIETQLAQYETLLKQIAVQRQNDGARMVVMTQGDW